AWPERHAGLDPSEGIGVLRLTGTGAPDPPAPRHGPPHASAGRVSQPITLPSKRGTRAMGRTFPQPPAERGHAEDVEGRFTEREAAFDVVGDTGIEPVTSSV